MPRRTRLHIADDFWLPVEVLSEAIAVLATRGAGKTYTMKVLVEEALKVHWPVVVFDPMHAWWGLRSSADGKGPGFPIAIFGGENADLPLEPEAGKFMADLVMGEGLSCIFDIKQWSKTKRRLFVADFSERLLHKNKDPIFVVFEEAHKFAPQMTRDAGDKRMLGAVSDLSTEGRGSGIGVGVVTQRSARLNKDLLEEVDNLIILRTQGTNDRKAIKNWITTHELDEETYVPEVMRSLPRLSTGSGWVWSPVLYDEPIAVDIRLSETFDSSATPKTGQRRRRPKTVADINLKDIEKQMSETIARVQETDPKLLQKRVRDLEKKLADERQLHEQLEVARARAKPPKEIKIPVIEPKLAEQLNTTVDKLWDIANKVSHSVVGIESVTAEAQDAIKRARAVEQSRPYEIPEKPSRPTQKIDPEFDGKIGKGEKKILGVLAQWPKGRTHNELAFLAGYSAKASTLGVYLSKLRKMGLVAEGQPIRLTDEGAATIGGYQQLPSGRELLDHWMNHPRMGEGERKVLTALIERYPEELSHDELCELTGYSPEASTMGVFLSKLRKLGLVQKGRRVVADEFMDAISESA